MEIIQRPRQSGKTTELIKKASVDSLYIVCMSQQEADRIATQARKMGLYIPYPITFQEFKTGLYYPRRINGFVIDNIDLLMAYFAKGIPVKAATIVEE